MVRVNPKLALVATIVALWVVSSNLKATKITYTENTNTTNQLALGYPVPLPVDSQTPINGFRTYNSLMARHQDMMLSSDLIDGSIIGQTIEGENIWAYILSDSDDFTNDGVTLEPAMLQNSGIHAREWQTPEVITGIMERFFDNRDDQGFYQYLMENTKIVLIPTLNISGFRQTQRFPVNAIRSTDVGDSTNTPRDGRMRRKNMRNVDLNIDTESDFLNGIDLNRNNNPFWASSARSSSRVTSIVHHGSGPASEPETLALQQAAVLAGEDRLRFYIDTHSFTRVYFSPRTSNVRRNAITAVVANRMRAVNANAYGFSPSNAGTGIGATDEYFANTYQIPSYTLETEPGQNGGTEYGGFGVSHDGFVLPDSEINRVRNELANASILGYYLQAGPPSISELVISKISDGEVVFAGRWNANNANTRTWQETTNLGLEGGQNYSFWVAFNKPMRFRTNGLISNYLGQNVTINPQVTIEGRSGDGTAYSEMLNATQGIWLDQVGGSPGGYKSYADDAFQFEFQLANNTSVVDASLVQLAITTTDLAHQFIDASPATVVDWASGAWSNYEAIDGQLGDVGGTDRTIRIVDDGSAGFTIPQSQNPPPPSPPPSNPPPKVSSSGGGSLMGLVLILMFIKRKNQILGKMLPNMY